MTEVPKHLLDRSRERREALGATTADAETTGGDLGKAAILEGANEGGEHQSSEERGAEPSLIEKVEKGDEEEAGTFPDSPKSGRPQRSAEEVAASEELAESKYSELTSGTLTERDLFKVLGLDPATASEADVARAYKKLVGVLHPDAGMVPGDKAMKVLGGIYGSWDRRKAAANVASGVASGIRSKTQGSAAKHIPPKEDGGDILGGDTSGGLFGNVGQVLRGSSDGSALGRTLSGFGPGGMFGPSGGTDNPTGRAAKPPTPSTSTGSRAGNSAEQRGLLEEPTPTSDALGRVAALVAGGQLDGKGVTADLSAHLDATLGLSYDGSDNPLSWLTAPPSPSLVVVPQHLLDRSREARERHALSREVRRRHGRKGWARPVAPPITARPAPLPPSPWGSPPVTGTAPSLAPPIATPIAPARVVSPLAPPASVAKHWSTKEINAGILKQRRELIGRRIGVDPNSFSVTREIYGTRRALGRSAFTLPRKTIEGLGMLIKGKNRAAQSAAVSSVLFLGVVAANETRMDGKGLWLVEKPGQVAVSAAILFGYSVLNTIGLKVVDRFEERRASGYPRVTLRERAASSALARRRVEQAEKGRVARGAGVAPTVPTLNDWSSPRVASLAKESSLDLSPEQVQSVMVKLRERVLTGGVPDKALVLDVISDVKREDDGAASAPKP